MSKSTSLSTTPLSTPKIVGVAGGSASGKGTVVRKLAEHFGDRAAVLCMDDYYYPIAQVPLDDTGEPNFDVPGSIDLERFAKDVEQLRSGRDLYIDSYTFNVPNLQSERLHIPVRPLILLDGLYLLHHPETRKQLHLALWVDATPQTRLDRRLHRDSTERGLDQDIISYQWDKHVRPGEIAYLDPHIDGADLVLENNVNSALNLDQLIGRIEKLIA